MKPIERAFDVFDHDGRSGVNFVASPFATRQAALENLSQYLAHEAAGENDPSHERRPHGPGASDVPINIQIKAAMTCWVPADAVVCVA